jgi:hypothetical protein
MIGLQATGYRLRGLQSVAPEARSLKPTVAEWFARSDR